MRYVAIAGIGLSVAVIAAYVGLSSSVEESPSALAPNDAATPLSEVREVVTAVDPRFERLLSELRQELARIKAEQKRINDRTVIPQVAPVFETDESPPEDPIFEEEQVTGVFDKLEEELYQQQRDQEWSGEQEDSIQDAFGGGAYSDLSLVDVECMATICRLNLEYGPETDQQDVIERLMTAGPFAGRAGAIRSVGDADGRRLELYSARTGYDL